MAAPMPLYPTATPTCAICGEDHEGPGDRCPRCVSTHQTHCPCGTFLLGGPPSQYSYFADGLRRCSPICDGVNYDD